MEVNYLWPDRRDIVGNRGYYPFVFCICGTAPVWLASIMCWAEFTKLFPCLEPCRLFSISRLSCWEPAFLAVTWLFELIVYIWLLFSWTFGWPGNSSSWVASCLLFLEGSWFELLFWILKNDPVGLVSVNLFYYIWLGRLCSFSADSLYAGTWGNKEC